MAHLLWKKMPYLLSLAVEKMQTTSNGGTAVELNGGTITGEGKLICVGGDGHFGEGGNAVSGMGTISVANAYLEGGASVSKSSTPGKALGDNVKLAGTTNRNLIDGENVNDIVMIMIHIGEIF